MRRADDRPAVNLDPAWCDTMHPNESRTQTVDPFRDAKRVEMNSLDAREEFSTSEIDALLENIGTGMSQHRDQTVLIDVVEDENELILRFRNPRTAKQRYDTFQDLPGRGGQIPGSVFDDMLAHANRDDEDDREDSRFE